MKPRFYFDDTLVCYDFLIQCEYYFAKVIIIQYNAKTFSFSRLLELTEENNFFIANIQHYKTAAEILKVSPIVTIE